MSRPNRISSPSPTSALDVCTVVAFVFSTELALALTLYRFFQVIMATTASRYTLSYTGGVTTATAKAKSLKHDGPLVVAKDNMLAVVAPKTMSDIGIVDKFGTSQLFVEGCMVGGFSFADDLLDLGIHFIVGDAKVESVIKAVDANGFDDTPILGGGPEEVATIAAKRFTAAVRLLPEAERTLTKGDVWYVGPDDNAETGTWFDELTPRMLLAGEADATVLAQFRNLLPGIFTNDRTDGRQGDDFGEILDHMLDVAGAVGRDISSSPAKRQAQAVVQWFKATRPAPAELARWIGPGNVPMELERRAGKTQAERYEPLLRSSWRLGYEDSLNKLWPFGVMDIVHDVSSLAVALNMPLPVGTGGLVPEVVGAVCKELESLLPFATQSGNEARTKEILDAHKGKADDSKLETMSAEARSQLQADSDYIALLDEIRAVNMTDHAAIAKIAMAAKHPAGLLFLNSKFAPDRFWKERNGARLDSVVQSVFTDALSIDTAGLKTQWGTLLERGYAKQWLAGQMAAVDWWKAVKATVIKREGAACVQTIQTRIGGAKAKTFWSDPERMRLAECSIRAVMAIIGHGGTGMMAFSTFYKMAMRMANTISNLPNGCRSKNGLAVQLEDSALAIMQCAQDRTVAMLATPAEVAKRLTSFAITGPVMTTIIELDNKLRRIATEIEQGTYPLEIESSRSQDRKRRRDGDGYDDWEPTSNWQRTDGAVWGSCAKSMGITAHADGKRIAFGKIVVTFDEAPDISANCVACFAPRSSRDKWCPTPGKCWSAHGDDAHARPEGFPDSACKGTDIGVDAPEWSEFTKVIAAPKQGKPPGGGRGGGKGKGGKGGGRNGGRGNAYQGKGGGRGGDKGGGKGKGGKGKGGGKGGGGRGRQNFGRQ